MEHNLYTKPYFRFVNIEMNDLCAGSNNCSTIDLKVINLQQKKNKTYTFGRGKTEGMWENNF